MAATSSHPGSDIIKSNYSSKRKFFRYKGCIYCLAGRSIDRGSVMSRRRYLFSCVGCCNPDTKDGPQTTANSVTDGEYLLPGGEWDPSISTASNRSTRSMRSNWSARLRRSKSDRSSDIVSDGNYSPPPFVPHSRKLPTFEDFRLLKTVGKGAFGKVPQSHPRPCINYCSTSSQLEKEMVW